MKVAVLKYHYNYAGSSSHRTSDGWFKGDYISEGVLIFTTQEKLSIKQDEVINNFINECRYEESDNRSDGPDPSVFKCEYSKSLSESLADKLLFDIIKKEDVAHTLFPHRRNEHRESILYIDGIKFCIE